MLVVGVKKCCCCEGGGDRFVVVGVVIYVVVVGQSDLLQSFVVEAKGDVFHIREEMSVSNL